MLKEFDDIIEITLHHEGGYVNDPNAVSYKHLRANENSLHLVLSLLL